MFNLKSTLTMVAIFLSTLSAFAGGDISSGGDCMEPQFNLPHSGKGCQFESAFVSPGQSFQIWQCSEGRYLLQIHYNKEQGEFKGCPIVDSVIKEYHP